MLDPKEADLQMPIVEAVAIVLLVVATCVMSLRDQLNLERKNKDSLTNFTAEQRRFFGVRKRRFTASPSIRAWPWGCGLLHTSVLHTRRFNSVESIMLAGHSLALRRSFKTIPKRVNTAFVRNT